MGWYALWLIILLMCVGVDMATGKWGPKVQRYGFFAIHPSLMDWWENGSGAWHVTESHKLEPEEWFSLSLFDTLSNPESRYD